MLTRLRATGGPMAFRRRGDQWGTPGCSLLLVIPFTIATLIVLIGAWM